ncbi:CDP-glycerol glycerophosphotransferase family protein [Oceanicoccus sp. KOV_DT_Chl]|uniref:CDP-glycerol glycerophosphotransferase family protein n=1 Tax=Oceanicoccus sp. KOV_DT_Chl TaxID=1904639 RepID=UPI000C7D6DFC|nr:CDP-glycerol glycerophosphotransferase family protein [Oceanicoccus sp. KOV_DT_Chl]
MNNKFAVLLLLIVLMNSETAYAYLDPASGNAIASFFIAIFGSIIFFIKSVFYKLLTRSSDGSKHEKCGSDEQCMPVIFSEGKTYWTTFRPIIEELISQKIHFRYITLDVYDPGLEIDNTFMHSRRLPKGRLGFAKIANIKSPVMLSTTPNIGSAGYPVQRPSGVINLVHVFHSMVDLSCYHKGSLDFYDSVLIVGPHEERSIRLVESARNLKKKELVVAGLPYLDDLERQKYEYAMPAEIKEQPYITVLVAPSWGAKGCFSEYGTNFVKTLAEAKYRVIVRLHPHSYIFEPEAIDRWIADTKNLSNVTWDDNVFGTQAMSQADILISDASSIRFDFAFLYQKPVITLPISRQSRQIYESDYMTETWADTMAEKIGVVVNSDKIHLINQIAEETIKQFTPESMEGLRNKYVANNGSSSVAIAAYLKQQTDLLSMTATEQPLKHQMDVLRNEIGDIRKQPNQTTSI